jgi:hypothetical protein
MSDRIHNHRRRRMATPEERQTTRDVAAFVQARGLADSPLLITLALVSGQFPDIRLDDALAGVVFWTALVSPPDRSLLDKALLDLPARGKA